MVILTLPSLEGESLEDYSVRTAQSWGMGDAKTDRGLLLLIAAQERKLRLEVGYGLEAYLTDAEAYRMMQQNLVPALRAGNLDKGLFTLLAAIEDRLKEDPEAIATERAQKTTKTPWGFLVIIGGLAVLFVIDLSRFWSYEKKAKSSYALHFGEWFLRFAITYMLLRLVLEAAAMSARSGGSFGGTRGGGGFSSGGGGFGGGGASSSW
jgi:uncharacterized protein